MTITLDIDPQTERWLEDQARACGEPKHTVAARILKKASTRFVVKPFSLGPTPQRFTGMTPSEIDAELELENYVESRERA